MSSTNQKPKLLMLQLALVSMFFVGSMLARVGVVIDAPSIQLVGSTLGVIGLVPALVLAPWTFFN